MADGRSGAVMVIQRFGGALDLHLRFHVLVLDGVFARRGARDLAFHEAPRLTTLDVAEVLAAIEPRVARLIERRDVGEGAEDGWDAQAPVLAGLAAAFVQATSGSGQGWADRAPERLAGDDLASGRCLARANGFSLQAGVVVPAGQRARLEQVCRYVLRPPVASERLAVAADSGRASARPRRSASRGGGCVRRARVRTVRPSAKLRPPRARSRGGGRLQLIALIEQTAVITRILRHLGLPSEVPALCPPRSPPMSDLPDADAWTW